MKIIFFAKMTKMVLTPSRDDKVSTMMLFAKLWTSKKASGFTASQNKLCLELPLMLASTSNDLNRISAVIFFLAKNFSYDIFSNFPNQTQKHRRNFFLISWGKSELFERDSRLKFVFWLLRDLFSSLCLLTFATKIDVPIKRPIRNNTLRDIGANKGEHRPPAAHTSSRDVNSLCYNTYLNFIISERNATDPGRCKNNWKELNSSSLKVCVVVH